MARPKILTLWFAHLKTKVEQEKFTEAVFNNYNNVVLRRLYDILKKDLSDIDKRQSTEDAYTNASWPYLMAHMNGEKQSLKKLIDLLEFTQEKE